MPDIDHQKELDHKLLRGRPIAEEIKDGNVVLISSDFEEVVRLADRALAFDRGRQVGVIEAADLTVGRVTALSSGTLQ